MAVIGWDIGGVNTKVARLGSDPSCGVDLGSDPGTGRLRVGRLTDVVAVRGRPYELQRAPGALVSVLRELAAEVGLAPGDAHAVTMTAELSQMFRTKREGVAFVLDAVEMAFPASTIHVYTTGGSFVTPAEARHRPLDVAAANWAATAHLVARDHREALLVDIGTTSTDIIPIVDGEVVAVGRTDPDRLASGELVYTGALRTPVEAILARVPLGGGTAGVSAEGFALAGDVHVWRGDLACADYTVATPDGRPVTREFVRERLARVVCGDREMLDDAAISAIADAVAEAQTARVAEAIGRAIARHPSIRTAVVTGLGGFVAARAARAAGLEVVHLAAGLGEAAARCAPAAAVALLLSEVGAEGVQAVPGLKTRPTGGTRPTSPVGRVFRPGTNEPPAGRVFRPGESEPRNDAVVVKVGGALLRHPAQLDAVLAEIVAAASTRPLLIVPGGGPFADAVRDADRRCPLSDGAAHWMAILGMDQHALLLADRLGGSAVLVRDERETRDALHASRLCVLAPSAWLRAADPLPHSWDVTSDSIAAWVAGALGVRDLVVVKAPGASGDALVDPHFERVRPAGTRAIVIAADAIGSLGSALRGEQADPGGEDGAGAAVAAGGAAHAGDVGAGGPHE